MKTFRLFFGALEDFIRPLLPWLGRTEYRFGFLVHPRDISDVSRKYPFLRSLPKSFLEWFTLHFWPVTLSKIKGVSSSISGRRVDGFVFAIPLTARQMMENRPLALKRIRQALRLAQSRGVRIMGLGALTSSLSRGGLDLTGVSRVHITTGHAYTVVNVTANVDAFVERFQLDKKKILTAIVGAAGSVGSSSAKVLARAGYSRFLLIDVERKAHTFEKLSQELLALNPRAILTLSHRIKDIREADIIVAATNAPEALIVSDDVKPGAIIVDDAQPSDVSREVLLRPDVLVVEAGVVHTPGIRSHFNFGLKSKEDNFSCLAEVLLLASREWKGNYILNRPDLFHIDQVTAWGKALDFRPAAMQNFLESLPLEKINYVGSLARHNHTSYA